MRSAGIGRRARWAGDRGSSAPTPRRAHRPGRLPAEPYAIRLHREVAEAICAGDSAHAELAMRTIVVGALEELDRRLG
ncbi:hypothetical protein [Kitasatospora sp. NPDC050543]|uniref:hypothetical protein n=1 Tax=Kitasatospora sp. NPDC050543 TaxID=3364054 RepID=UPI0037AF4CA7